MSRLLFSALLLLALAAAFQAPAAWSDEPQAESHPKVSIRPKEEAGAGRELQPDTSLIDTPTTAVLDYQGFATTTRFFSHGGVLEHLSFGVFRRVNLGASLDVDRLIGSDSAPRLRAPNVQVKFRFFDGDRWIPSFAVGFDGQGQLYDGIAHRYNNRHRGFFLVASQELLVPGLEVHPSINISDFDSNSIYGAIPVSLRLRERALLMAEWDNVSDWSHSRMNAGLRLYLTGRFHADFAVRAIGQGGHYDDGTPRGPERIVQLKYNLNF